jgi:hypothetical protein
MSDSPIISSNTSLPPKRTFLENIWVLRVSLFICSIIPAITLISLLHAQDIVSLIILGPVFLLVIIAIGLFDPYCIPKLSQPGRFYGYLFKVFGIGHAILALRMAYEFFEGTESQGSLAELDQWRYVVLALLWIIAALGYLSGDVVFRRQSAQRAEPV